MRLAQKDYFKLHSQKRWTEAKEVLTRAKALEKSVDTELEKII